MTIERRRHPRIQLEGVKATLIPAAPEPATYEDAQRAMEGRAMEGYLQVETRESARAEAYLCGECGYAAGVHDESCSRFAEVLGQ